MINTTCVTNLTGIGGMMNCADKFSEGVFFDLLLFGIFLILTMLLSSRYTLISSMIVGCFLTIIIGLPLLTAGWISLFYIGAYTVLLALLLLYQSIAK